MATWRHPSVELHQFPWRLDRADERALLRRVLEYPDKKEPGKTARLVESLRTADAAGFAEHFGDLPLGQIVTLALRKDQVRRPNDRMSWTEAARRLNAEAHKRGSRIRLDVRPVSGAEAQALLGSAEGKTLVYRDGTGYRVEVLLHVGDDGTVANEAFGEELGHVRQFRARPAVAFTQPTARLEQALRPGGLRCGQRVGALGH